MSAMSPIERRRPAQRQLDEPRTTLASAVAEFALERGVSDRTVWRWLAAGRTPEGLSLPPPPERRQCQRCGRSLRAGATIARRYCDDVCRVYAWRGRRRAALTPREPRAGGGHARSLSG